MFIPNHLHLLVKGYILIPPKDNIEKLNDFLTNLVERVRMKVIAGPTSVYVDYPGNEGATGTITLATSHASIHIWDNIIPSLIQFDLYSCSYFEPNEVISCINDHFKLLSGNYVFIDRNVEDFKILEQNKITFSL